ncbi:MAG: AAA family ATPase [Magnetococcales bacterium]|nr:AAA family ATPase [Magnetococcales bacterium]
MAFSCTIRSLLYESQRTSVLRILTEAGTPAVLKLLNDPDADAATVARFRREADFTRSVSGIPGFIGFVDMVRFDNVPALVLEDIGGTSLDRLLDQRWSVEKILELAVRLAGIIDRLHQAKVLHKDISLGNIVWNPESGELQVIDFGISSRLERERVEETVPGLLEGTLATMAPEQTGRINRDIDHRADLYGLGACLHHLFAGRPLFDANTPMAMIHAHLTRKPEPLDHLKPDLPKAIASIVLKLLAKDPDQRYQSARGACLDLSECLEQWRENRNVVPFVLGRQDRPNRILPPHDLFGREKEQALLSAACRRARDGAAELFFIAGYAGIGKTALARGAREFALREGGWFGLGKFDQSRRESSFSAWVAALREVVRQRLAEPDERIDPWRKRLLDGTDELASVLVQILPELKPLVGSAPPPPELPPLETRARFQYVMLRLITSLTAPGEPLFLFLDDLQWADISSLELLNHLATAPESNRMLILGAYRDHEVGMGHPLASILESLGKAALPMEHLTLGPLDDSACLRLTAAVLAMPEEEVAPLAGICRLKSGGNPFFILQFYHALHRNGQLWAADNGWQWNMDVLQDSAVTDNILDLLEHRLKEFPEFTIAILARAAFLGHVFDLPTLSEVTGEPTIELARHLEPLLVEGMLLPRGGPWRLAGNLEGAMISYRFVHDRVQQAAALLVPVADHPALHLDLARRLLSATPNPQLPERLSLITGQFNQTISLLVDPTERRQVAELNLLAGQNSQRDAAFAIARVQFDAGLVLLGDEENPHDHNLTVALFRGAAESSFALSDWPRMTEIIATVVGRPWDILEQLPFYVMRLFYGLHIEPLSANHALALNILRRLGLDLPQKPSPRAIASAREEAEKLLTRQTMEKIRSMSADIGPNDLAISKFFYKVYYIFQITELRWFEIVHYKIFSLLLKKRIFEDTPFYYFVAAIFFASKGMVAQGISMYQFGFEIRRLPQCVNCRNNFRIDAEYVFGHWFRPLASTLSMVMPEYLGFRERGQTMEAAYSLVMHMTIKYYLGKPLGEIYKELCHLIPIVSGLDGNAVNTWNLQKLKSFIEEQTEDNSIPFRLQGEEADPPAYRDNAFTMAGQEELKLESCFRFGNYQEGLDWSDIIMRRRPGEIGAIWLPLTFFYDSLCRLALMENLPEDKARRFSRQVAAQQRQMKEWAVFCPENYRHKYLTVEGERERVKGHYAKANALFEEALVSIRAQGGEVWLQEEALLLQLAGQNWLQAGNHRLAGHTLRDAAATWRQWGAEAIAQAMEGRYPQLLRPQRKTILTSFPDSTESFIGTKQELEHLLDLPSLLRAAHAISREIDLERLVTRVLALLMENAGATEGALALVEKDEPFVVAAGKQESIHYHQPPLPLESKPIPEEWTEAIRLALRSREIALTDNPSQLVAPLLHRGQVEGVVLLTNHLTPAVFTPDRAELVRLLGAHAVVAMANANAVERLRRSREEVRRLASHAEGVVEAEKKRIAGEMHDELGSNLTGAKMFLNVLQGEVPPPLRPRLVYLEDLIGETIQTVRNISVSLSPPVLDCSDLLGALRWLAERTVQHAGLECQVSADSQHVELDLDRRRAFFRIAQEALTNVVRHADANRVEIRVIEENGEIEMRVTDDGRGVSREKLKDPAAFGLAGMRERARYLQGDVTIAPTTGGGTQVTARIPNPGALQTQCFVSA